MNMYALSETIRSIDFNKSSENMFSFSGTLSIIACFYLTIKPIYLKL